MKGLCISVLLIGIFWVAGSSCTTNEQVSRYQTRISENETDCFFKQLKLQIASSDGRRLLEQQKVAVKDLAKTWRYDEQYIITTNGQRSDIDLTLYFDENNSSFINVYIAGPRESLDSLIKNIEGQCKFNFKIDEGSARPKRRTPTN